MRHQFTILTECTHTCNQQKDNQSDKFYHFCPYALLSEVLNSLKIIIDFDDPKLVVCQFIDLKPDNKVFLQYLLLNYKKLTGLLIMISILRKYNKNHPYWGQNMLDSEN